MIGFGFGLGLGFGLGFGFVLKIILGSFFFFKNGNGLSESL